MHSDVLVFKVSALEKQIIFSFPLDEFSWNFICDYFRKYVEEVQVSLKSDKNNGYFIRRPIFIYDTNSLISSRMTNVSDKKAVQKIKVHIFSSIILSRISCRLLNNMARPQMKISDGACDLHAGKLRYKHTLRIWHTTAFHQKQWLRERPSIFRLSVHCMCFLRLAVTCTAWVLKVCTVGAEPRVFWALKYIFGLSQ